MISRCAGFVILKLFLAGPDPAQDQDQVGMNSTLCQDGVDFVLILVRIFLFMFVFNSRQRYHSECPDSKHATECMTRIRSRVHGRFTK